MGMLWAGGSHPLSLQVFRPTMDQCLSRNYLRLKKSGVRTTTWLKSHSHLLQILVPMAAFNRVLAAEGEWGTVANEITTLMDSSVVARTIFGFCGQLLSASNYMSKIEQYLGELASSITMDSIESFKVKAQAAATAFKALGHYYKPMAHTWHM